MTYPHFIEVHDIEDEQVEISINIDHIVNFHVDEDGQTVVEVSDSSFYFISESYAELKDLIRSSGCAITKADPRLDMSIPLSMDELVKSKMIGEPVFNSNTRAWMLVADSALDNSSWVDLVDHAGKIVRFGPHDVVKFPLYRMRRDDA